MSKTTNKGKGNIEARDDWETPKALWDQLDQQYKFNFDCCAVAHNSKCIEFSSNFENWDQELLIYHTCWINPPFSKAAIMLKHFFANTIKGVGIYRCDNIETKIWQDLIFKFADWVFIPNKRIQYEGKAGKGAVFPSALFGVNLLPPKNLEGVLIYPKVIRNGN